MRSPAYGSKIDGWLAALSLAGVVAILTTLSTASHIGGAALTVFVVALACTILGLLIWVIVGTYYRFDGGVLVVCSGPFRWRIPVKEIQSIEPSNSPVSGPALSLDRLCIRYGEPPRIMLISPRDRSGFLQEFERRRAR
jgi:hypothetical protein